MGAVRLAQVPWTWVWTRTCKNQRPFPLLARGLVRVPDLAPSSYLDRGSLGHLQAVRLTWLPLWPQEEDLGGPRWPAEGTTEPGCGQRPEEELHTRVLPPHSSELGGSCPNSPRKLQELQWREGGPQRALCRLAATRSLREEKFLEEVAGVTKPRNTCYLDQPSSKHPPRLGAGPGQRHLCPYTRG